MSGNPGAVRPWGGTGMQRQLTRDAHRRVMEVLPWGIVTGMGLSDSSGLVGAFFQEFFAGYVKFTLAASMPQPLIACSTGPSCAARG